MINIHDGQQSGLTIYPEFSRFAVEINAILDVDMYIFPFIDEE
ncbi:hypothetical protein [Lysinibacillus sp. 54212]